MFTNISTCGDGGLKIIFEPAGKKETKHREDSSKQNIIALSMSDFSKTGSLANMANFTSTTDKFPASMHRHKKPEHIEPTDPIDLSKIFIAPLDRSSAPPQKLKAMATTVAASGSFSTAESMFGSNEPDPSLEEEKEIPPHAMSNHGINRLTTGSKVKVMHINDGKYHFGRLGEVSLDGRSCIVKYYGEDERSELTMDVELCGDETTSLSSSSGSSKFDISNPGNFVSFCIGEYHNQKNSEDSDEATDSNEETDSDEEKNSSTRWTKDSKAYKDQIRILEHIFGQDLNRLQEAVEGMKIMSKHREEGTLDSQEFFTELLTILNIGPYSNYYCTVVNVKEAISGDEAVEMVSSTNR